MIDIHSHILPCLTGDDGSRSDEMTIEMAKQLVNSGFNTVYATPHHIPGEINADPKEIDNATKKINLLLNEEGIALSVLSANEIFIDEDITNKLLENKVLSMNKSGYVLIELPMNDIPMNFESIIFDLKLKGYMPIIAHPERNAKIKEDRNIIYRYLEMGAYAQLNLRSLSGKYGKQSRDIAMWMLSNKYYQFIGSDGHNMTNKSMDVIEEINILKKSVDEDYFDDITCNNPTKITENFQLEYKLFAPIVKKGKFDRLKRIGGFLSGKT